MVKLIQDRDRWEAPYGVYIGTVSATFFNRRYEPIARVLGRWPRCNPASAFPIEPTEWIDHHDCVWFYDDGCTPRRNKQVREQLLQLLDVIPVLRAEVERRQLEAKRKDAEEARHARMWR